MERLRKLIGDADVLRGQLAVASVSDDEITAAMRQDYADFGFATCPHTATATHTWRQLSSERKTDNSWILVATAHPAKFETIVEPLIGDTIAVPKELEELLRRPTSAVLIEPDLDSLAAALNSIG